MTALAAAAAVATIVGTIASIASGIDTSKKLSEINSRLDSIIATQEAILIELRNMKAYFDDALLANWKDINENTIQVQYYRFAARVESPLTPGLADELTQLLRDLENPAFSLATRFGLAAYVSFASALSLELLIYRKLRKPRLEVVNLAKAYSKALQLRWLNKEHPASVYSMITETSSEVARRVATLDAQPRKHLAGTRADSDGECTTTFNIYTIVAGSFEAGFSASASEEKGKTKCFRDPCRNPRVCITAANIDDLNDKSKPQVLREGYSFTLPVVPPFVASGNNFLDPFLKERTSIFERKRDLVAYEILKEAMESMVARLEGQIA